MSFLDTAEYFILLALADGPANGPMIVDQMVGDSVGGIYLRPSTLYATMKSLESDGLIEQASVWAAPSGHVYRKSYKLSDTGKTQLSYAARMHARASQLAKARLGLRY